MAIPRRRYICPSSLE